MFPTFGRPAGCATSKVVKIAVTSSRKLSMDGSGPQTGRRWHRLTRFLKVGASIHGRKPVTRKPDNRTTLNST